jgi:hypothetical protein
VTAEALNGVFGLLDAISLCRLGRALDTSMFDEIGVDSLIGDEILLKSVQVDCPRTSRWSRPGRGLNVHIVNGKQTTGSASAST